MAWGVLDDKKTPRPPGTIVLEDVHILIPGCENAPAGFKNLKQDGDIVLQPQPSDSPNDPLNWSMKVKISIFLALTIALPAIKGVLGMLGTAGRVLADEFDVTYPKLIETVTPAGIAANAFALFIASAVAAVWGKRLPIFVGIVGVWLNMIQGYFADSLISHRNLEIANGLFSAAPELLVEPIVTDLVFVHQRGRYMAAMKGAELLGMDISHIISGNVVRRLGVKYLYIISFGVCAPIVVAVFLFVRETTYCRKSHNRKMTYVLPKDPSQAFTVSEKPSSKTKELDDDSEDEDEDLKKPRKDLEATSNGEEKRSWSFYLQLYQGRLTPRRFWKSLLAPLPMVLYPHILVTTIINGAMLTLPTISSIISHEVLLYPPYDIEPDTLAYLELPGSVVGLFSSLIAGWASDWLIRAMAKSNGGVYEPEWRLLLLVPATLFSTIGFLLLGPLYARSAPVEQIVAASLLFDISGPFASSACITYIFDSMQDRSTEAFVATSLFEHFYGVLVTSVVPDEFERFGSTRTFVVLAGINLGVAGMGVPMYVFGKRARGVVGRLGGFRWFE